MDVHAFLLSVFLALSATIINQTHLHVTHPFIDEFFHLRQCLVYCKHDFFNWDPKITTPPGLYILGTAYAHVLHALGVSKPCGPDALRFLNFIGGAGVLPAVLALLTTNNYWKINLVSMPLLYSYYFLFYTDVWSTVLVVMCVALVHRFPLAKGAMLANLAGFCSLWFRQTNIVWIGFCAVIFVDRRRAPAHGVFEEVASFVKQSLKDWLLLIPFAANFGLFAAFLKVNGGITFGDKENHHATLHVVQVFYCLTLITILTFPVWLSKRTLNAYFKLFRSPLGIICNCIAMCVIYYIIEHFTVIHPFLLADNRHYTFYVYRRILSKSHLKILLIPVYHFLLWLVPYMLKETTKVSHLSLSPLSIAAMLAAMAATLIPSPLFEPRYYMVPLVLFRLHCSPRVVDASGKRHLYEFLWYLFFNTVYFVVFFTYKFTWLNEPGYQRIIW